MPEMEDICICPKYNLEITYKLHTKSSRPNHSGDDDDILKINNFDLEVTLGSKLLIAVIVFIVLSLHYD